MSEVALQIIATIGDELQMARDEVQKLKKELKEEKEGAAYWYKKYDELTNATKTKTNEVTPF